MTMTIRLTRTIGFEDTNTIGYERHSDPEKHTIGKE